MVKKFPNTSVLTIITQTECYNEKVLFIYLKPVPDYYSLDTIHWYNGTGKNGKANNLWDKLLIKQWFVCGKDEDIINLLDEILLTKNLNIDNKEIPLIFPRKNLVLHNNNSIKNRGEKNYDCLIDKNNSLIPHEFYQKENLKFLSGYRTGSNEIKPFFPLGFFEDDFIYDKLKKGIWGIKEYRTAYLTFQGVRETSNKGEGSKEMVGFYQQNYVPTSNYTVVVKNENNIEIGKAPIDIASGFFKIALSEPTQKGKVEVFANSIQEKAIEYVLLQDIKFNAQIASKTFKDAYGRNFMISSKEKQAETLLDFTWQKSVYIDDKIAFQKLSDLFKNIFDYLGPRVIISDPYFIGQIKVDDVTKQFLLTHCQQAFINALIHSTIEKRIEQLSILGYWKRAKNQIEKNDTIELSKAEQLFSNYEKLFKGFIKDNKLQKYFQSSSIQFLNAKEDFHNRYWFSLKKESGAEMLDKCVIVTNSIGNIIEVDIVNVSDNDQAGQIIRKRTGLFKNAEQPTKLTI